MKKTFFIALGLALGLTQNVSAQTIFSCTTKSGKIATLDKEGGNYIYAFGKPHKTEIRLTNPIRQVLANKLTGKTLHAYASNTFVALTSGNYTYVLRHYFAGTKYPEEANIFVLKNGKKIADLPCTDWSGEFDDDAPYSKEADFDSAMDLI